MSLNIDVRDVIQSTDYLDEWTQGLGKIETPMFTRLAMDAPAAATEAVVYPIPKWMSSNLGWVAIGVGSSSCEIRKFTTRYGSKLTISALTNAHTEGEHVLFLDEPLINVKWFGAIGDGSTDDSTAIQNAITQASSFGGVVLLPGKSSYAASITFPAGNVTLMGIAMALPNSGYTALEQGTIIKGTVNLGAYSNITIRDLGIDATGESTNALSSGSLGSSAKHITIQNVSVMGDGYAAADHGIVLQSGSYNEIHNIRLYNWYHGLALRCSHTNVSDVYAYQCTGNSIIVKSDATSEDAKYINITNVDIEGTASGTLWGGPIRLQSSHASYKTRFINITNVSALNPGEALIIAEQDAGICADIKVTNAGATASGDTASRATFDVKTATDVVFIGCSSVNRSAGYGFRTRSSAARVIAKACRDDATGAGTSSGSFEYFELTTKIIDDRFDHINYESSSGAQTMRAGAVFSGAGNIGASATEDLFHMVWTGAAGTYCGLVLEVELMSNAGGHTKAYKYRIACNHPGSTTLEAAAQADGSTLASGGGATATIAIGVDVGTASTLKVQITESSAVAAGYAYIARVVTSVAGLGIWTFENKAA